MSFKNRFTLYRWLFKPPWKAILIVWTAAARGSPSRSHTLNIAPARLAERVWCTEFPCRWVLLSRSFSHVVTAAIFVYKTMKRKPCLCTKKSPVGIELFSQVKIFFYSKQFAKLLTTWLKTKLRRGRQRERQKSVGLVSKATTLHMHHAFLYISLLPLPSTTTTWNDQILSFVEDGNGKAIDSTISVLTQVQHKFPSFK